MSTSEIRTVYTDDETREIIFPLGGIGTGSIGLSGAGRLVDWEIFNRPNKGSRNGYSHIAVRARDASGRITAKILNGDLKKDLMGTYAFQHNYSGYGFGPSNQTMAGLPHFRKWTFNGTFPTARIDFSDPDFPGKVSLTAYNPMIPNDEFNSSLPGAFFTVTFTNDSGEPLTYAAAFSLQNPYKEGRNVPVNGMRGVHLVNTCDAPGTPGSGDMTLVTDAVNAVIQPCWYRGGWQDGNSTFWREFSAHETLLPRTYETAAAGDTATLFAELKADPGQTVSVDFILTWNAPVCYNYWVPQKDENGADLTWKNWYATVFEDSAASAAYCMEHRAQLWERTCAFRDALFSVTADPAVVEAAASNLAVLKTATVMRLEDGSFYGWEGIKEDTGSCEGTCTHVWNYAYALCFLFPRLERSIRNLDYAYNQQPDGSMTFRLPLPLGQAYAWKMPCVDGEMGGVYKVYRDWKLCGDDEWLRSLWPGVKRSLSFAWDPESPLCWDKDHDGVLEGRQHHTLDMELFGPSSWLEGFYLLALKAAAEMAEHLGDRAFAAECRSLFESGSAWTEKNLFNGKYYIQKVDLHDEHILDPYCTPDSSTLNGGTVRETYWNDEAGELKYQIGDGSEIDQMCAQWHAAISGLGDIFDPDNRQTALDNLFKNNFKPSMREVANLWRIFAVDDDSGAIICDYPEDTVKPVIPIPYCEEAMHGFEYQLAGLLMSDGRIEEGVRIVKGIRDRYNGSARNPWNEMECGNNYARSMASFALIPILAGFRFDLPRGTIGFCPAGAASEAEGAADERFDTFSFRTGSQSRPLRPDDRFRFFWSVDGAWGTVDIDYDRTVIEVKEGVLRAHRIELPYLPLLGEVFVNGKNVPFRFADQVITLPEEPLTGIVEIPHTHPAYTNPKAGKVLSWREQVEKHVSEESARKAKPLS